MNTKLRKKAKNNFEKDFFKLMNNAVFGKKNMENLRKHRDIKLIRLKARRNYLVLQANYYALNFFLCKITSHRNEKKHKYSRISQSIWVYQY